MQSFHDFFSTHGFDTYFKTLDVNTSVLNEFGESFYIVSESYISPLVKVKNVSVSWEKFLIMRKDFVERVNDSIKTLLPHKSHFCFDKTCFWSKLYLNFGINFFNYIFDNCEIYIQINEGQFLNLGKCYPNFGSNCNRSQVVEIREICIEKCGYDRDLYINRIKMMYNNVLKCKSNLAIRKQNILTEVFKQDVGCHFKYDVKQTKMIKNLKKIENSDLCISHARSILKNSLKPKVPIISKESVLLFLRKILSRIIPNRIFNKKKHFLRFLENLSIIIERNLGQCVTLGEIMHGVVEGKNLVLQNMCAKIVLWLINEVVFRIINCCFYVTETNKSLELVYVLLPHWIKAEKTAMKTMITNGHLKKIDIHEYTKNDKGNIIDDSRLASLRFVPKDSLNSFRPIIQRSTYQKDTDKFAKTCNIFLKQLAAKDKNAVMNIETNIYKSWKNFMDKANENTEFYFIKTDIKDAYGSILHVLLKDILNKLISEIITKNTKHLNLVQLEYKKFGNRTLICEQFAAEGLPFTLSSKIIRKRSSSKTVSLDLMRNYIFDFIDNIYLNLKNSKDIYHKTVGLPQGMKLSAALCEIYYNDFDSTYLKKNKMFMPTEGDIFLRSVDDYLFVSKSKRRVLTFFDRILTHNSKYGFNIQREKTMSNALDVSIEKVVPYFGFIMDLENKTLAPDLSIYAGKTISSTISFRTPITLHNFRTRLYNLSAIKMKPMLLDQSLMSKKATMSNLFKMACLFTLRFDAMLEELQKNEPILPIFDILRRAVSFIAAKTSYRNMNLPGRTCLKRQTAVKYIIYAAFISLMHKKNAYSTVILKIFTMINHLRANMSKTEYKRLKKITKHLPSELEHSIKSLKKTKKVTGFCKGM